MKNRFRIECLLLTLVVALSGFGCMGYRLGSMLPKDIRTVYIPTFVNKTTEPMIENATTDAAIREFQQDGSLKVVRNPEDADAILEVVLTSYTLDPISYDATEKTTANEYRMTITASLFLKRRATGQIIVDRPSVYGDSTFPIAGDFTSSQTIGLPEAADKLAQRVVEQVTEAW